MTLHCPGMELQGWQTLLCLFQSPTVRKKRNRLLWIFSSEKSWCRSLQHSSAVTGGCTHGTAPLARTSSSARRSWAPWGHHLYCTSVLPSPSTARLCAGCLEGRAHQGPRHIALQEHSQLDTSWLLSARVVISPSRGISAATYGFSRAAEQST